LTKPRCWIVTTAPLPERYVASRSPQNASAPQAGTTTNVQSRSGLSARARLKMPSYRSGWSSDETLSSKRVLPGRHEL
jgi:hypothetical protein